MGIKILVEFGFLLIKPPAPIANFDCIILYPEPLGSDSGCKNTSILFFACSGNTKLYNNGTAITIVNIVTIMYLLSIPAENSINATATIYANAVP